MSIYLDHNATTPMLTQVLAAYQEVAVKPYNCSSVHGFGRQAKAVLDTARQTILKTLNAQGGSLVFTATGTEANDLALYGLRGYQDLFVGATEHISILEPAKELQANIIPVDQNGIIQTDTLDRLLTGSKKPLVSIQLANNETGVIQPIAALAEIVFKHHGFLHVDASQAVGKIAVDITELRADLITISGHKCGAGQGAAALIYKKGLEFDAQFIGGGQEKRLRAGTENIAAIGAFATAVELAKPVSNQLQTYLENALPEAVIFSANAPRLPYTTLLAMPNIVAETQLMEYDLAGLCVSSGSACSSGKVGASHVLDAMGVPAVIAKCAIRVSTHHETTPEDIDHFISAWQRLYHRLKKEAA